jgi:hypothetical protein
MGMSYEDLERALVRQGAANAEQRAEIERLHGLLKRLFLLAMTSNDIRPDAAVLREVGQAIAAHEQEARTDG